MAAYFFKIFVATFLAIVSYYFKWWMPAIVFPLYILVFPNFYTPPPEPISLPQARRLRIHIMRWVFYALATTFIISQAILFQNYFGSWYGWLIGVSIGWIAGGVIAGRLDPWLMWKMLK
ncbi:MAG: hypothetical protein HQ551_03115 [Desulfobacteraceae bacterium]|nr:hypothetical protein [Desulfobacteraceae bacterium]